jgi:hypothetical protein
MGVGGLYCLREAILALLIEGFFMRAKDLITNLGYGTYTSGNFNYQTAGLSSRYQVIPGPIVHGNMRDPNGWNYVINDSREIQGEVYEYPPYQYIGYKGFFGGNSDHPRLPTWERDLVYNMCLEKLNSKVRGNLDLGVGLAEAGSTYRMLKGVADLVRYAESYVRRPKFRDAANWYLQWKYGWNQLLQDIFGAADESIRVVINDLQRISARVTLPLPSSQDGVWSGVHGLSNVPYRRRTIGKQSCTIVLDLYLPGFRLDRWTSLNPVSLAWELIPYSFVVDWVFDVGSYLRGMETALLYQSAFRSGYVSEIHAGTSVETLIGRYVQPTGANAGRSITKGYSEVRRVQFIRTKLGTYPFPRKPTFKVDLGGSQLMSAAALLTQVFTKGR